jgi:hypothetical protein
MCQQEEVFKRFQESLACAEGHLHLVDGTIPTETQMAYFQATQRERMTRRRLGQGGVSDDDVEEAFQGLRNEVNELEQKKHSVVLMAVSGTVKALRRLEACAGEAQGELAEWLRLAISEVSVRLQTELLGEPHMLIASGLGGKDGMMRFFTLFGSNGNVPFEDYQRRLIEKEFAYILTEEKCEIELLKVEECHVELLFLVPVAAAFFAILSRLIGECNEYGNFLSPKPFVTNIKRMTSEEIEQWKQSGRR